MAHKSPKHLILRANTWMIRLQVPAYAQHYYKNKKEILRSTKRKQHEVEQAKLDRDIFVAQHKLVFDAIKRGEDLSKFAHLKFGTDQWADLLQDERSVNPNSLLEQRGVEEMKDQFNTGATDEAIDMYVTGGWSAIDKEATEKGLTDPFDAIKSLSEKEAHQVDHHLAIVKGKTFGSLVDKYLKTRAMIENTQKHQDSTRARLKEFAELHHFISDIKKSVVSDYKDKLEEQGLASNTISTRLGMIAGYWTYLAEKGIVDEDKVNPFQGLKIVKHVKHIREHYSIDEAKLLVEGKELILPSEHLLDFIKMGLLTGCRVKELCNIKSVDIINEQNIRVIDIKEEMTKGNSRRGVGSSGVRKIPITSKMQPIIDKLLATQHQRKCNPENKGKGYIFDTGLDKYGDITKSLGPKFGRYKNKLGFPKHIKVAHSFRHTANTLLAGERGGHVDRVNRDSLFGWSGDGKSMGDGTYLHQDDAYPLHERKKDLEKLGSIYYFI